MSPTQIEPGATAKLPERCENIVKSFMRTKCALLPISIFVAVMIVVSALSACGNKTPGDPASPAKSSPASSPKPSSSPTFDPNAPPAAFKPSNLRAEPVPDGGANEYWFYVDVENVGGQPGTYTASYRIDNDEVKNESKKITVNPGKTKSLELIGPEQEVLILGQAYDEGLITERQHVVSTGNLSMTITLAERYKLEVVTDNIDKASGNITVSGEVKNISDKKIDHIIAVADFRITDGRIMWIFKTAEAPVAYEPVMPGQTTPFRVVIPNTIPNNLEVVDYRVTFKNASGEKIRARTSQTQ